MMTQQMPSATSIMLPVPSAEELHTMKEMANMLFDPNAKKKTFRMVKHFVTKPPISGPISRKAEPKIPTLGRGGGGS